MDEEARRPLLAHDDEDRLWDRVEEAPPDAIHPRTMKELMKENPDEVLKTLSVSGVKKLGEFSVADYLILGRLDGDSICTMGAESADIDFKEAWMKELRESASGTSSTSQRRGGDESKTGWTTEIPVVAYVVTIQNAAAAGSAGLLQPLVRRFSVGGIGFNAFALPAGNLIMLCSYKCYVILILGALSDSLR